MSDDPHNAFITRVEPGPAGEGPLAGRTLAVKDLFDTAGIRTTYGSGLYADHVPERNATAVQRLLDAGAVIVGKTHLPEFAWSVLGQSEWYGTCHNPTHPGKTTGGSSSGSAAALAAGLCELALGIGHGLLHPPALGHLRGRRAQVAVGADLDRRRVPARADARHGRPDGAQRRGRRAHVVGAHRATGAGAAARRAHGRAPSAATRDRRRARDRAHRRRGGVGRRSRATRRPRRRGAHPRADREHVAAVPARGAAIARRDVSEPRGRVRRAHAEEAPRGAARDAGGDRGGVPGDRGVARGTSRRSTSTSAPATPSSSRRRTPTSSRCGFRSRRSCAG